MGSDWHHRVLGNVLLNDKYDYVNKVKTSPKSRFCTEGVPPNCPAGQRGNWSASVRGYPRSIEKTLDKVSIDTILNEKTIP